MTELEKCMTEEYYKMYLSVFRLPAIMEKISIWETMFYTSKLTGSGQSLPCNQDD